MSKIEWTEKTWNPIIGCSKISDGCQNCYAEKMANRLKNIESTRYYHAVMNPTTNEWSGECAIVYKTLLKPSKRKKPTMYFVCSMGDLFHESIPFEWILSVWDVMCQNPRHTYQLLTKRPERIIEYLKWLGKKAKDDGLDSIPSDSDNYLDYVSVPEFIWIGVTVENQERANERIPILLRIPAVKRFVSCEPLLSDIDFPWHKGWVPTFANPDNIDCVRESEPMLYSLDWVIAGPETGPKARLMQKEWIQNIYNQCMSARVPFFDKKNTLGLNLKQLPNE